MNLASSSYPDLLFAELCDESRGLATIKDWIAVSQEEHLYLDFTRKHRPNIAELDEGDKRKYAKALSGFANSDGGLLVWGVRAERERKDAHSADVARDEVPIANASAFRTKLNHLVQNATKPVVAGVRNAVVRNCSGSDAGFVVTYVPAGTNPPYRAELGNENSFYKRAGSTFYRMEPYDIRDVILRFGYPKLEVTMVGERVHDARLTATSAGEPHQVSLTISNQGPVVFRDYKLEITVAEAILAQPLSQYPDGWIVSRTRSGRDLYAVHSLYTSRANSGDFTVYPGDQAKVLGRGCPYDLTYSARGKDVFSTDGKTPLTIRCRILGANAPPLMIEKPVSEMYEPE